MLNVTEVKFNGAKGDSAALYQFDYGQILTFPDLILPEAYEVHFARQSDAQTITMIGTADGVTVPDEMLLTAGHIKVYIYLHEGETDGETEYKAIIPVIARPEPSDIEPTPVQQDVITQAIAALNVAVDEAEGYAQTAQEAAESIPEHVLVYDEQTLTDSEKAQARANIGASDTVINNLKDGSYNQSLRQNSAAQEGSSYTMGGYASAFGSGTKASGGASHAEGYDTTASNTAAHSEGRDTVASGVGSHAEGWRSVASASQAHAEGRDTVASGTISHAEGEGTIANHRAQTVAGQFNIADPASGAETERGTYVEIIGNGANENARSNARTLDWAGNEVLSGKLTVGASAVNAMDVPTLSQVQGLIPSQTDAVKYTEQSLTDAQKTQARQNIDAGSLITDTASGDPCAITDGASAPVVDCKVSIVPKQSGSGTPSPSNVRPISGWTEMTMRRTGLNLWDEEWELGTFNTTTGANIARTDQIRTKNLIPVPHDTLLYINAYPPFWAMFLDENESPITLQQISGYSHSGNCVQLGGNASTYQIGRTYTVPSNARYMKFYCQQSYGTTYKNDICISVSGSKNGTYEPYKGTQEYTASWTPTVYGGTLDLTTGLLTVGYAMVDISTLTWTYVSGLTSFECKTLKDVVKSNTNLWCTALEHAPTLTAADWSGYDKVIGINQNDSGNTITGNFGKGSICAKDSDYTTVSDFVNAMSGVYLCYELAEPTETIQLTPTEVQTILGSNTFSADTGSVEIEYRADTALWVENHVPSKTSQLMNDSGFITASNAPVRSVNGKTGVVTIANATTTTAGLMSATDKANLDTLMDDYTSAMTALGV